MNISQQFYIRNRRAAFGVIASKVLIVSGNVSLQRSNDASYRFEQEANFWYLTGINEAGWTLVSEAEQSILIAPDIDEMHRIFDGGLSFERAQEISGVDKIVSFTQGKEIIKSLAKKYTHVATLGDDPHKEHYNFFLNPGPVEMYKALVGIFEGVEDFRLALAKLRAIKQPEEIEAIRKAIQVTADAFKDVKEKITDYAHEYEVEADFSYHFRSNGASGHAYDPIVAGGENACTLHYGENSEALNKGEFILLDIGARVDGYAADITRTYALGKVSERYQAVHGAVEKAHKEIIGLLHPGLSIIEYHEKVDLIMKAALVELGLLNNEKDYRIYFPHAVSHGLGIDVHDSLGRPEVFKSGMVLTVEPGIYIPEEGIGVRIEDDILITDDGNENLSGMLSTSL